ncbi:MAG: cbb3-type cytochrome c oxidase subunit I, partial [Flavobacteriales bacterium]
MMIERFEYDNRPVRAYLWATIAWGAIGMLVGLWAALELVLPQLNLGEWFTFGRLRPLHTNSVIFAFVGNGIFAGVYYSLPRLLKTPMWSRVLSWTQFWSWQAIIVSAAITLPLGITASKEYAELEWPIDIAITISWILFGINM